MRGAPSRLLARIVGAALVFGAGGIALVSFFPFALPWSQALHMTVAAGAFGEMNPQAGVELGGVRVGSVDRIEYSNGTAVLHLSISPQYAADIHGDATASIRPHGLLGPKYVELDGGRQGRMPENGAIPVTRTHVTTDFDQVLNTLQPDVRQNLKVILVELGTAANGRGDDMNAALKSLGDASADLKTVTGVLNKRRDDTNTIIASSEQFDRDLQNAPNGRSIADTDKVLTALVEVENSIGDGIDRTAEVLQALDVVMNGNSGNLAETLAAAPGTVAKLNRYLDATDALIGGIRPALPALLTAVVEGETVTGGRDANGHYVRVLALSGPCTAAPDPAGLCSSGPPVTGASTTTPATSPGGQVASASLSDTELMALFLGR